MSTQNSGNPETISSTILEACKSLKFWSAASASIGFLVLIIGGITYLLADNLKDSGETVSLIGIALLILSVLLAPKTIARGIFSRYGRYGSTTIIMTLAFLAIVVIVYLMLYRNPTRIDVTATRVFTLAPQTIALLDNLDEPIKAKAFFVPNNPTTEIDYQKAEGLLNESDRYSSKFDYQFIDQQLNKSTAEAYGVRNFPVIVFENLRDGDEKILQPINRYSEQSIHTAILIATGKEQKVVYSLTGHGESSVNLPSDENEATSPNDLSNIVIGMLSDNYAVLSLSLQQAGQIPDDAALVMIAGPKTDMDQTEFDALTNYMQNGGSLVMLLDPGSPRSYIEFLNIWGIDSTNITVADPVSNRGSSITPVVQKANGQYNLDEADIQIAAPLDTTFFTGVTALSPTLAKDLFPSEIIRFVPLAFTTPASWLETNPTNTEFDRGSDLQGAFPIAVVVEASGTVDGQTTHPTAKFAVFGDSDFITNEWSSFSDNGNLFLNSVNWLTDDYELISIRPRLFPMRELIVNSLERDFIKWSGWLLPPATMMVLAFLVWWRRR